MSSSLLRDEQFLRLEKDYPLLSRAREKLLNELERSSYIILDIETTGLDPSLHEIIEIGALKVQRKEIKDIYNVLIKPSGEISPHIKELTGISQDMVVNEPTIDQILPEFREFIAGLTLIAHNTDFDINFLSFHFNKHLQKDLNNRSLCTVRLAQTLLPNLDNHKLHTVAHHFQIPTPTRHRAIGDAEITYQVWNKLLDLLKDKEINTFSDLEKLIKS